MKSKQFLNFFLNHHEIPLKYSLGVQSAAKKYSCAAVACILRINFNKTINRPEKFSTIKDLFNNFDEDNYDKVEILFIQRTTRGGDRWSGDVAFPGGFLNIDESDKQGVTREVFEELGLNLADTTQYQWLGRLKHIDLGESRTITPHLFFYLGSEGPLLKIEKNEVAGVEWVNLRVFLDKVELDTRVSHVGDLYSRSQGTKSSIGQWLFSAIAFSINCSLVYFPAVRLPVFGNYESTDHVNEYRLRTSSNHPPNQQQQGQQGQQEWILWGMTFKFVTDLLRIVNKDQSFYHSKLPFWFDNKQVNMTLLFWNRILSSGRRGGASRVSLIVISFSSLFGLYGVSLYALWKGYSSFIGI